MDECSLPQNSKTKAGGSGGGAASKLLAGLPSRGFFSSTVPSTNPGGMRVYICDHDTNPPAHQVIKTDQMNILIRSLKLKKQKGEMKGATSAEGSKKRVPERATDGRASTKRPMTSSQTDSQPEGSNSHGLDRDYHSLTVERLRALLKERALSPKGKKDELVARLRGSNK